MWVWALLALVLFLVAGVMSLIQKAWTIALIAFGLAAIVIPDVINGIH